MLVQGSWFAGSRLALARHEPVPAPMAERAAVVADLQHGEGQGLFGFVRRLGLTDEQADDAVQEVFTRLLAELHRNIAVANPRSWAYRSIYRLAMDQHRLRRRLTALTGALGRRPAPSQGDVTDRITVWSEVDLLPERQRHVIYLRYRSDLPFEEIGQALGITSSAARSHATQAVATLRLRLTPEIEDLESD